MILLQNVQPDVHFLAKAYKFVQILALRILATCKFRPVAILLLSIPQITMLQLMMYSNSIHASEPSTTIGIVDRVKLVTPSYITLTNIENNTNDIVIDGVTEKNANISKFMRLLEANIGSPNLEFVKRLNETSTFKIQLKKKHLK